MRTAQPHRSTRALVGSRTKAAAALAVGSLLLAGCADGAKGADGEGTTARIGTLSTAGTMTAGQSTGDIEEVLDEDGHDVSWEGPFLAFAPAAEAAAADQIDASSGSTTTFLTALESGTEIVLIGEETLTQGILATGESGITDVEDLEGAQVAVNLGGTGEYLLHRALESAEIDPNSVEFVNLSPEDASTAFSGGDVDAWATWDQYFATAELQEGASVVVTDEDIDALNLTFHWVTKEFYDEHPDVVASLAEGIEQSSATVQADPDLILDLYREYGADKQVLDRLETYDVPDFETADAETVDELETLGEELVRYGMVDDLPEIEPYVAFQD